ncbi:Uncharacterised protein [Streptococcus pneumoniae]|nr:Uncharacterised protein [Streptococcus pneumoniae]
MGPSLISGVHLSNLLFQLAIHNRLELAHKLLTTSDFYPAIYAFRLPKMDLVTDGDTELLVKNHNIYGVYSLHIENA